MVVETDCVIKGRIRIVGRTHKVGTQAIEIGVCECVCVCVCMCVCVCVCVYE